ncbi:ATP synthase F1 subunit delta [Desertivirga brevis]|uniref:ATP synthase F1 subunit delta n=1 Tax=Desertivirga brevis TaxID=2810310 RepID=UPI001A977DCE|nr:ATP synthase F1 subunit delta [Pedobacter sp. SYSU D00873]
MSEIQVASRYAKSLIDLAKEQNSLELIKLDIDTFISVVSASSQLQAILKNPIINTDKKLGILNELFGGFNPVVLSFFKIVVSKGRSSILFPTAKEFINEYNRIKGTVRATVTSASPLSEAVKAEITQVVQQSLPNGGSVELESKINPDLIGGFVLKVGDRQIDTTIASRLNQLKKEFGRKI